MSIYFDMISSEIPPWVLFQNDHQICRDVKNVADHAISTWRQRQVTAYQLVVKLNLLGVLQYVIYTMDYLMGLMEGFDHYRPTCWFHNVDNSMLWNTFDDFVIVKRQTQNSVPDRFGSRSEWAPSTQQRQMNGYQLVIKLNLLSIA